MPNNNGQLPQAQGNTGWFKAMRSPDALELIRANPLAFVLAYVIASRARWREGFNADGLALGEALVGDWKQCGLSRQQYRTALRQLEEWQFATIRPTKRGTFARLANTRLFDVLPSASNDQSNHQLTISQPSANHQLTTNQEPRTKSKELKSLGAKAGLTGVSRGGVDLEPLLLEDRKRLEAQADEIAEKHDLDPDFVGSFLDQHNRDDWTIPNKRTGKRERIKHLEKALVAFCTKLENDRHNS
jgi:hypothetical protein